MNTKRKIEKLEMEKKKSIQKQKHRLVSAKISKKLFIQGKRVKTNIISKIYSTKPKN